MTGLTLFEMQPLSVLIQQAFDSVDPKRHFIPRQKAGQPCAALNALRGWLWCSLQGTWQGLALNGVTRCCPCSSPITPPRCSHRPRSRYAIRSVRRGQRIVCTPTGASRTSSKRDFKVRSAKTRCSVGINGRARDFSTSSASQKSRTRLAKLAAMIPLAVCVRPAPPLNGAAMQPQYHPRSTQP